MNDKGKKQEQSREPWMKSVKHFSNRKDRQATRQAIHHEQYDDLSSKDRTKTEDPWGWD